MDSTQIWVIVGVAMLIAELLSVTFVFLFLSVGAFVTAILSWTGLTPTVNSQLFCFSVVSVLSLLALRKPLLQFSRRKNKSLEYSEYVGDKATVVQTIPSDGEGRVFYRGTEWIALTQKGHPIAMGSSVIIKQLDGIKLIVSEPETAE
ncbi:NfeD family protein [Runella sp. CRIBMP]|uniref:NfeD family protein n=1 Tax=Runella salmonicolor TaxID=2950278 RepID=A0ABT1FMR9_9BACT|nr:MULTISPECIES: NfeD family protein [Runella]MCP1383037.1 NfeD family protein [Runella salmonicolor]NBB22053.1 NfeD family protein [Runella sp. CRIBMP]